ncbi:hypothetical protein NUM3379_29460 [Kineococcus sp. NUM-3379]
MDLSAPGSPEGTAPGAAGTASPHVRDPRDVSGSIAWTDLHRTSRTRPTVTTFGWRGKILLSVPPALVVSVWMLPGLASPVGPFTTITVSFGLPLLWALRWWLRQVWAAGPRERTAAGTGPAPATPPAGEDAPPRPRAYVHPNFAYLRERPSPVVEEPTTPGEG